LFKAYVGPPNASQPPPVYTAPNFASQSGPAPTDNPPPYSAYPPQPYPQQYNVQPYPAQPYPAQPYPPYPSQPYPAQAYPAYPNQPYPAQPYPNQPPYPPVPDQPVVIVHTSPGHAIDAQQPLPCGGLGFAWLLYVQGEEMENECVLMYCQVHFWLVHRAYLVYWYTFSPLLPFSQFIGAFYTCVGDPRERRGGRANLIVLIIWIGLVIV
jgi:hypothetical protein